MTTEEQCGLTSFWMNLHNRMLGLKRGGGQTLSSGGISVQQRLDQLRAEVGIVNNIIVARPQPIGELTKRLGQLSVGGPQCSPTTWCHPNWAE
jgi:hypothetical protein